MKRFAIVAVAMIVAVVPVLAETVQIECYGEVEYNQVNSGAFAAVNSGDQVYAVFTVDSEDFIDSANYGVRSFPVNAASFELTIGSAGPIGLVDPQPNGLTTYFNLRDADPVADGFFMANNTEWPMDFPSIDEPGQIDPWFNFHWEVGYEGTVLDSRDILDAVGVYDFTGLTSFYTVIGDSWADAMGLIYDHMIISTSSVATRNSTLSDVKALFE